MVLAELGQKINSALNRVTRTPVVGEEEVKSLLNELSMALLQADVNLQIVKKLQISIRAEMVLADQGQGLNKRKMLQQAVFNSIKKMLDPGTKPYIPKKGITNVVMFVGLQGSGKTTSCTKYALYFQKKGFKVALVCADTFRAGAYDQLKQNAAKVNVRFHGSMTESDPVVIAREGVLELKREKYDLIIVDTSGRHKQEAALFDEMEQIREAVNPNDIVYVMSATDGQAVHEQATQFKAKVSVGSVIVTKMDCHTKGGGALSAVAATQSAILFIGTGEHMDEFELFKPDSFVGKMLGMGDLGSLVDSLKDAKIDVDSELYKRMQDGVFTMRDMYEHLQNTMKIAPVGKLMEMIPGLSQFAGNGGGDQSQATLNGFTHILDSMTPQELDDPKPRKLLTPSRIARIARGSGKSVLEVHNLLQSYVKFEEVFKRIGKVNMKNMRTDPTSMLSGKMGQQQMGQIAKALNPQMLQQLGGVDGLHGMMKQLGKMGIK
eukprot:Tbor_TRINITY_DN5524_c5_g1::TRINITY_DN5524_c5_g1_i1::g.13516::m.13516/K03106/SRP54, ffh; signal recognition particle subunit SRP54